MYSSAIFEDAEESTGEVGFDDNDSGYYLALVNQFNVVGIIEDSTKLSRKKFHPFYILFLKMMKLVKLENIIFTKNMKMKP